MTLDQLIAKLTRVPSRILGLPCGLKPGMPADLLIFDPHCRYKVDAAQFRSKSRNSPFDGWTLSGKALLTMVAGRIVFESKPDEA